MSTHDATISGGGQGPASTAKFETEVIGELQRLSAAAWEQDLGEGVRRAVVRERFAARSRRRTLGFGLAAALAGGLVTAGAFLVWPGESPREPAGETYAFDGGHGAAVVPQGAEVVRDARGRIAEIRQLIDGNLEGERLLFRSGRLIRSEQWKAGRLEGTTVDYDAQGRVVATESWVGGEARGPWMRLGTDGRVEASGFR